MKRIIRLTEQDLNRIVRRVIKEQSESSSNESTSQFCSMAAQRLISKMKAEMSPDQIKAVVAFHQKVGTEGLIDKMKEVTQKGNLFEDEEVSSLRKGIQELAIVISALGTGAVTGAFFAEATGRCTEETLKAIMGPGVLIALGFFIAAVIVDFKRFYEILTDSGDFYKERGEEDVDFDEYENNK